MISEFYEAKQNQAKCQMWLGRKRNLVTDRWEETKATEISVFCFGFLPMSKKKKKKRLSWERKWEQLLPRKSRWEI